MRPKRDAKSLYNVPLGGVDDQTAPAAANVREEVRDYRDLNESGGFDKLVSVGMFEHVGEG
jgi:cyclopropane fatty-acyl-phospholipid synthase-like methyltransferase